MALNKTDRRREQICVIIDDLGGPHKLATLLHVSRQAVEDWYRRDVPAIPQKHWPVLMKMGVSLLIWRGSRNEGLDMLFLRP